MLRRLTALMALAPLAALADSTATSAVPVAAQTTESSSTHAPAAHLTLTSVAMATATDASASAETTSDPVPEVTSLVSGFSSVAAELNETQLIAMNETLTNLHSTAEAFAQAWDDTITEFGVNSHLLSNFSLAKALAPDLLLTPVFTGQDKDTLQMVALFTEGMAFFFSQFLYPVFSILKVYGGHFLSLRRSYSA